MSAKGTATISSMPLIFSNSNWKGANDRVNVAVIGIRGMGQSHIQGYQELKNVEVAALCDVDENLFAERVKKHFTDKSLREPKLYNDMRKLFEDKSIDAVRLLPRITGTHLQVYGQFRPANMPVSKSLHVIPFTREKCWLRLQKNTTGWFRTGPSNEAIRRLSHQFNTCAMVIWEKFIWQRESVTNGAIQSENMPMD